MSLQSEPLVNMRIQMCHEIIVAPNLSLDAPILICMLCSLSLNHALPEVTNNEFLIIYIVQ